MKYSAQKGLNSMLLLLSKEFAC